MERGNAREFLLKIGSGCGDAATPRKHLFPYPIHFHRIPLRLLCDLFRRYTLETGDLFRHKADVGRIVSLPAEGRRGEVRTVRFYEEPIHRYLLGDFLELQALWKNDRPCKGDVEAELHEFLRCLQTA